MKDKEAPLFQRCVLVSRPSAWGVLFETNLALHCAPPAPHHCFPLVALLLSLLYLTPRRHPFNPSRPARMFSSPLQIQKRVRREKSGQF